MSDVSEDEIDASAAFSMEASGSESGSGDEAIARLSGEAGMSESGSSDDDAFNERLNKSAKRASGKRAQDRA